MRALLSICLVLLLSGNAMAQSPEEGKPAPGLEGRYLNGSPFDLQQLRGKVVVVNFWATWCPSCREEMPALDALYGKYHAQGLEVIGISIDDREDAEKVQAAMKEYHYPVALLDAVKADGFGRIWHVPMTFVVDRQGVLRKNGWYAESKTNVAEQLEGLIRPLVAP